MSVESNEKRVCHKFQHTLVYDTFANVIATLSAHCMYMARTHTICDSFIRTSIVSRCVCGRVRRNDLNIEMK